MRRTGAGEGRVYRCTWLKDGKQFALKCLSPIQVGVIDADLEQAKEKLLARIMDITGDGEAGLEFVPPLPEPSKKFRLLTPAYFLIGYHDFVEWSGDRDDFYSGGICRRCGTGVGSRTEVPRLVTSVPKYDVAGFRLDKNAGWMISEAVLKHLPRTRLTSLIPVKFDSKTSKRVGSKKFYEVDFEPEVQTVVPRLHDEINGWRCPKCKTEFLLYSAKRLTTEHATYMLRRSAKGKMLMLGRGPFRDIAVDGRLHKKLTDDKAIKSFFSSRVLMLDEEEILTSLEIAKVKLPAP